MGVPTLQTRGLKPIAQLAADRDHGDRLRYLAGCRCDSCRRANTAYESARQRARRAGDWNGIVSAEKAKAHLKALSVQGVGRRSVSAASDVADSILTEIIAGRKTSIRARTERAILAVTLQAAGDRALVPANSTWSKLNRMLRDGHTKAELARHLGKKGPALQLNKDFVTVRTAYEVERLFKQLRSVDAKNSIARIKTLHDEGYTRTQIEQRLADLARSIGETPPSLEFKNARIPAKTADLIDRLYGQMTA